MPTASFPGAKQQILGADADPCCHLDLLGDEGVEVDVRSRLVGYRYGDSVFLATVLGTACPGLPAMGESEKIGLAVVHV